MFDFIELIRASNLCGLRRSLDVICFCFRTNYVTYCLSCQCFVRLFDEAKLIASSCDMLLPASDFVGDYECWDWSNSHNGTLFDEQVQYISNCVVAVKEASIKPCGDINIECDDGMRIEIIISTLSRYESWRFFEQDCSEKFTIVCYGTEIVREF